MSAFNWQGQPSALSKDPAIIRAAKVGRTASQIASEATDKKTAELGRSPGTIQGLASGPTGRVTYERKGGKR